MFLAYIYCLLPLYTDVEFWWLTVTRIMFSKRTNQKYATTKLTGTFYVCIYTS